MLISIENDLPTWVKVGQNLTGKFIKAIVNSSNKIVLLYYRINNHNTDPRYPSSRKFIVITQNTVYRGSLHYHN